MAKNNSDSPAIQRVLYDMVDAQKALGIGKPTLYGLIGDGTLATIMVGQRRFTTPEMLKECVATLASRAAPLPSEVPNNRHRPRDRAAA